MSSIQENMTQILRVLGKIRAEEGEYAVAIGELLVQKTGLNAGEVNDAVTLLVESGLADWLQWMGTGHFNFGEVHITPRGRYELERAEEAEVSAAPVLTRTVSLPPSPVGSPYGFTDMHWEVVAEQRSRADRLYVSLGYQFESDYYDSDKLKENIKNTFSQAIDSYNQMPQVTKIELVFRPLAAGYGEHLFNEIARDIISSDIAVFETSDLNPNVMLELGVALTWGVRVLPIKVEGRPRPPSDISGHTWVDYRDSGSEFVDDEHDNKLLQMIQRAARKKG